MSAPRHIGVFGGSFNPPQVAHALAVAYVLATRDLDEVRVLPTFIHPFDKKLVAFDHRTRMCELAMRDLRRVRVSRLEEELGGKSYTVRTLRALQDRQPDAQLRLIIGRDVFEQRDRWKHFDEIERLAPPIVLGRSGYDGDTELDLPQVSSTEVRRRLSTGEKTDHLVARPVLEHIRAHGLYGA